MPQTVSKIGMSVQFLKRYSVLKDSLTYNRFYLCRPSVIYIIFTWENEGLHVVKMLAINKKVKWGGSEGSLHQIALLSIILK